MSVKKIGIIVLTCLFIVFVMSPALPMAAEPATVSVGAAGSAGGGATGGLNTLALVGVGAFAVYIILQIAVDFLDSDDYIPTTNPAHHGH